MKIFYENNGEPQPYIVRRGDGEWIFWDDEISDDPIISSPAFWYLVWHPYMRELGMKNKKAYTKEKLEKDGAHAYKSWAREQYLIYKKKWKEAL